MSTAGKRPGNTVTFGARQFAGSPSGYHLAFERLIASSIRHSDLQRGHHSEEVKIKKE